MILEDEVGIYFLGEFFVYFISGPLGHYLEVELLVEQAQIFERFSTPLLDHNNVISCECFQHLDLGH